MVNWSMLQCYFTKMSSVYYRSSTTHFSENLNESFYLSKLHIARQKVLKHAFVYLHFISIWQKVK